KTDHCSAIHNISIEPLIGAHPETTAPALPGPYRTTEEQRSVFIDYLLNNN
uniref:Uncharacterized protein n=1 Tax=Caenorhabditis japonica TaxID=281687 RepID=A0A8R1IIP9_CAEJA